MNAICLNRKICRWKYTVMLTVMPFVGSAVGAQVRESVELKTLVSAPAQSIPRTPQLGKQIEVRIRNMDIRPALRLIAGKADLDLTYASDVIPDDKRVTFEAKAITAEQALRRVLELAGLNVDVEGTAKNRVNIKPRAKQREQGEKGGVIGRVVDSMTGVGVQGVTVTVVGTKLVTTTLENGTFTLRDVPVGEQRVSVRLFGYRTATQTLVVVGGQSAQVQFRLVPTPTTLSGVVTTVTGLQRRLEIPTAVTQLNVDSIMSVAPIRSVTDLLEARVPGLQVMRTSGTPGDPSRLRLRGVNTINGDNAPIVIVDGVRVYAPDGNTNPAENSSVGAYASPSPLDQIDPNTIATIEVFKGPSASSLYGSDAANGVIVITTKRGQPGKLRTNVTATMGTSSVPGEYPENTFVFGRLFNTDSKLCRFDEGCEIDSLVTFQAMNDPRWRPLGRANTSEINASINGGTNVITYRLTAGTRVDQGVVKLPGVINALHRNLLRSDPPLYMRRPDRHQRINFSNNLSVEMTPTLQIAITNELSSSEQKRSSLGTHAAEHLLYRYIDMDAVGKTGAEVYLKGFHERVRSELLRSRNTLSVRWQARPRIPVQLRAGLDPSTETGTIFTPAGLPRELVGNDTAGDYSIGQRTARMSSLSVNTTTPVQLRSGINIPLSVGADWRQSRVNSLRMETSQIPKGVSEPSQFPESRTRGGRSSSASSTYGWYVEPRVNLRSRLFVQTGMRLDGGSASGANVGFTAYPKLGLSWLAIDPSAMQSPPGWLRWLSELRLYGALGRAGVEPRPLQHFRMWGPGHVSLDGGETLLEVWNPRSIGNTKLRPERATEFSGGADMRLLANRVFLTVTAYRKEQRDAIMDIPVAASVGAAGVSQSANIGDILNTGIELTANAQIFESRALRWGVDVSFSQQENRLTRIAEGMSAGGVATQGRLVVGYPVYGFWAIPLAGFADQNGDSILQRSEISLADSSIYRGTSQPRYNMSLSTTVQLFDSRVQLSASADYQHAIAQLNMNGQHTLESNATLPTATLMDQAIAIVSRMPNISGEGSADGTTPYYLLQNVNVLRFRSVALTLTMPKTLTQRLKITRGTLALQGSNLGVRTGYRGLDPNVNKYASGNLSADSGQIPQPREWWLRVNLYR